MNLSLDSIYRFEQQAREVIGRVYSSGVEETPEISSLLNNTVNNILSKDKEMGGGTSTSFKMQGFNRDANFKKEAFDQGDGCWVFTHMVNNLFFKVDSKTKILKRKNDSKTNTQQWVLWYVNDDGEYCTGYTLEK